MCEHGDREWRRLSGGSGQCLAPAESSLVKRVNTWWYQAPGLNAEYGERCFRDQGWEW